MSKIRQIRDFVIAAIMASTGMDQEHVYRSPRHKIPDEDLPAISVYSHGDRPVDLDADHQIEHTRIYTLAVDLQVVGENEEDATEALTSMVLAAILADDTCGGLSWKISWASQTWGGVSSSKAISGTQLLFDVLYLWEPSNA